MQQFLTSVKALTGTEVDMIDALLSTLHAVQVNAKTKDGDSYR